MPARHDEDPLIQAVLAGNERGFKTLGEQLDANSEALGRRFDDLKEALLALQTQTDRAINRTMRVQLAAQGSVFLLVIFVIAGFMAVAGVNPTEAAEAVNIIAQASKSATTEAVSEMPIWEAVAAEPAELFRPDDAPETETPPSAAAPTGPEQ